MHQGAFWKVSGLAGEAETDYLKYERAAAAYARFCGRDIADAPEALIGKSARAAWFAAAQNAKTHKRRRIGIYVVGGVLIAATIGLAATFPALLALVIGLPASWLIGTTMRTGYRSQEPRLESLIEEATPDERDCILNLDEFCRRAASGRFGVVERHPDGSRREFNSDWLKCFAADGGKLLVLSSNPADWLMIRRRPVPRGEILIDIRGSVASTEITSRTLIDVENAEQFETKLQWLLGHAGGSGTKADSFRKVLGLVVAFRRPDFVGKSFEAQKEALEKEGYGRSMIEKVHAGIYEPFQRFLRTLPLNEFP